MSYETDGDAMSFRAGYDAGYTKGHVDGYNFAKTEAPRDWTPCAEGLPEKVDKRLWSRDVLATIKQKTGNCFVVVAYYHYGHKHWKTDDMTDNDAIDVIAWQPLPAAWKEPENV